uniref:uncharacterized protein LOC122606471 n=1 Tax=Erigeron canadensis TaxID=72917 RepID=UPI001CB967F6|nr:uncharacterized protein LOC122606471 [Erigeron canadensis]
MAKIIVLGSYNMMHSTLGFSKNLPMLHMMINKSTNYSLGIQGQTPIGGVGSFRLARRGFSVYSVHPGNPPPPSPTGDSWQQWIFGIITTIIVPFLTTKWSKLLKIKDEVDTVIEETEKVVDCVEEVAETVDKVAKDVEGTLPQDGKWRKAAVFVERLAEEISKEAHLVDDFLHEVEEVEEKVELLWDSNKDESKIVHHEKSS